MMKAFLARLVSRLQIPFNRDKERTVFCPACGGNTPAEFYRCRICRHWVRSPIPLVLFLVLLCVDWLGSLVYLWKVIPTVAAVMAGQGQKIWLPVRLAIAAGNFIGDWFVILAIPAAALFVYLGFLWRPHRRTGQWFLLGFAVLVTLAVQVVYLLTLLMAVIWFPGPGG